MLEMLCDTVEVDDYKANKAKELKMMNAIMDERRRQREKKEETRKFQEIKKEVDNSVEEYSKILLKEKSRKVSKDELDVKVSKRRQFIGLETIDSKH